MSLIRIEAALHCTEFEIQKTGLLILRMAQRANFVEFFHILDNNSVEKVKADSVKLTSFDDCDKTMGLRGRLNKAANKDEVKHPIVFSAKKLAMLSMLREVHENIHHQGTIYVRSLVQQRFWVIGLRNALRSIKAKCVVCGKMTVQPVLPRLADLRKEWAERNANLFKNTRVNNFVLIETTVLLRRPQKHWCSVLTSLDNREIHEEILNSLDPDACMMTITRFMTRRGRRHTVITDNGTNFVGGDREFNKCFSQRDWHTNWQTRTWANHLEVQSSWSSALLVDFGRDWSTAAWKLCLQFLEIAA